MWLKETSFSVRIGGNNYIDCPVLIQFRSTPLFSLVRSDDGTLAIDFEVFDVKGEKLASVKRNNIYLNKAVKDAYRLDGDADRVALIEAASGAVVAEVRKGGAASGQAALEVTLRTYLPNGRLLDLGPEQTNIGGLMMKDCTIGPEPVALQIN